MSLTSQAPPSFNYSVFSSPPVGQRSREHGQRYSVTHIETRKQSKQQSAHRFLETLHAMLPNPMLVVTPDGWIMDANPAAARYVTGLQNGRLPMQVAQFWPDFLSVAERITDLAAPIEARWKTADGEKTVLATVARQLDPEELEVLAYVCVASDLTERKRLEVELREAQKLESLGQLAAGVAHEINTPMQFIGDNLNFIKEVLIDLMPLLSQCVRRDAPAELRELAEEMDLDFIMSRCPSAVERALEGVARVTEIVAAMRSFAHPDRTRSPQDLNNVLKTSLVLAKNEYKYVAHVTTELGNLPLISGNLPDLSQMFVNLLVNAAHAIEDRHGRDATAGHIHITTQHEGGRARVTIRDNGCGIPEAIRHKVFDPFFTTKDVGRGTGQGLSIVHNVVQRHQGKVSLESVEGEGTAFHLDFPTDVPVSIPTLPVSTRDGGGPWT